MKNNNRLAATTPLMPFHFEYSRPATVAVCVVKPSQRRQPGADLPVFPGELDAPAVKPLPHASGADSSYCVFADHMQEGAVTVSSQGLVLYCNRQFAAMLDLPLERIIRSPMLKYLSVEAWQKTAGRFDAGQEPVQHECLLETISGRRLPVRLIARHLLVENQNVTCLLVLDLTEKKKYEAGLLARTAAEKSSAAKDDFLAALSHELRVPLAPVLMLATAMEQDAGLPRETRRSLATIRRNVELEARLIDDLLDLTRIARGKMELDHQKLDLHAIVQSAVEICRPELDAKSLKVRVHLNATRPKSVGDAVRLQQALWNLIRNAAKFSPENGSLIIRTANTAGDKISVTVQDHGIGFEPGSADKIFQAFEQGGRHVTRQFGGLGLGLAITRSIIEAHGGTIRAASGGTGQGATFTLELPLRTVKKTDDQVILPPAAATVAISGKRILLVEDHQDTRTSLEFLLEKNRHSVSSAATAREAMKLAAEQEFDLVISDIGLPDQSGLDLMAQLRDQFGLPGIGLSGYGMEEDIAKGQAAGFLHHLVKPVRFEQLKQVIAAM